MKALTTMRKLLEELVINKKSADIQTRSGKLLSELRILKVSENLVTAQMSDSAGSGYHYFTVEEVSTVRLDKMLE